MVICDVTRGNDIVRLRFEQTGTHRSRITLKDRFLDERLEYVVGVTNCTIPLSQTRMLSRDSVNYDILTIRRRNLGVNITAGPGGRTESDILQVRADLANYITLTTNPGLYPFLNTAGSLMKHIVNFFQLFSDRYRQAPPGGGNAIDPNEHGNMSLADQGVTPATPLGMSLFHFHFDPSGYCIIDGTPRAWNNFFIELTPFGKELLGFTQSVICMTAVANGFSSNPDLLINANQYTAANVDVPIIYKSAQSIFRSLEHRISLNVESSLPIEQQLLLTNGKEQVHSNLNSYEFDTSFAVKTVGFSHEIQKKSMVGLHNFQSSSQSCQKWIKLTEFHDLSHINLDVTVTRREWDTGTQTWKYSTIPLQIDKNARWTVELTFVSTS